MSLTGTVTLDGEGDPNAVFIFQVGSTLITAPNSTVQLIGLAQPCNVFWQVGSSATLGTNTTFVGSILALTSASVQTGTTVMGRVLARNGQVSLDTNTITVPSCLAPTTSPPTDTPTTPRHRPTPRRARHRPTPRPPRHPHRRPPGQPPPPGHHRHHRPSFPEATRTRVWAELPSKMTAFSASATSPAPGDDRGHLVPTVETKGEVRMGGGHRHVADRLGVCRGRCARPVGSAGRPGD